MEARLLLDWRFETRATAMPVAPASSRQPRSAPQEGDRPARATANRLVGKDIAGVAKAVDCSELQRMRVRPLTACESRQTTSY